VLARRAEETAEELDGQLAGLWLQATAYLHGGGAEESVGALERGLRVAPCRGVDAVYQRGLIQRLTANALTTQGLAGLVKGVLELGVVTEPSPTDLSRLAELLDEDVSALGLCDLSEISGERIYKALWLGLEAEIFDESLEGAVLGLMEGRLKGNLKAPTHADVCARALLMHIIDHFYRAERPDTNGEGAAARFLEAHLVLLRRQGPGALMPEMMELFWYADTLALLSGADRRAAPAAALGLEQVAVAQACVSAIFEWVTMRGVETGKVSKAAAAMLVVAASGLGGIVLD